MLSISLLAHLNMPIRGIENISNGYDKVIKQIDLKQYKEDETGYEFAKYIQELVSEEQVKAFHDRVDLCADTIQEWY